MKQEAGYFDGHEPELVYIAKRLSDALEIEALFEAAKVDFGVETDTYTGGLIFRSERVGAFFYTRAEQAASAREVLSAHGFKPNPADEKR